MKAIEGNRWPGGEDSWGTGRYWLEPDPSNNMMNRDYLAIRGGKTFGSNGCIDLEQKMTPFMDRADQYRPGKISVRVKLSDKFK